MQRTYLELQAIEAIDKKLWSGRKGESEQEICIIYETPEVANSQLALLGIYLMNIETSFVELRNDRIFIGIPSLTETTRADTITFIRKASLLVANTTISWDTRTDELKELDIYIHEEHELEEARQIWNDEQAK